MAQIPGALEIGSALHDRLRAYIEASYPLRNETLIKERRRLLDAPGSISQVPAIETTPSYVSGRPLGDCGLPSTMAAFLSEVATNHPDLGIYDPPYAHQSEALRSVLTDHADVLVTTGTGSGKTEVFLLSLLAALATEAADHSTAFAKPGMRALILYPMNALVSDQLARIRRLFGSEAIVQRFIDLAGRPARFGMYTSRTPYPGVQSKGRDRSDVLPIVREYLRLEQQAADDRKLAAKLKHLGRFPAKDLETFIGDEDAPRFRIGPRDAELMTRQEIQASCPDILITNYSMLEYMLIRPIERSIFQQTRDRLKAHPDQDFFLVLDEAHMYRGVVGGEVAYLIRRLLARLGIPRERLRCILTSASLGEGPEAEVTIRQFAEDLIGRPLSPRPPIRVIRSHAERLGHSRPGSAEEAEFLASVPVELLRDRQEDPARLREELTGGMRQLGRRLPSSGTHQPALRRDLATALAEWEPLVFLRELTSSRATPIGDLPGKVFPGVTSDIAKRALEALLSLSTFADDEKCSLLPTRLHLMYRGLPHIYACINPRCDVRREQPGAEALLGRLYTDPRLHCSCSASARTYEVVSHRDCGAVFLRVFALNQDAEFYWHESNRGPTPLIPIDLLLGEPHPEARDKVAKVYIELATGRVYREIPSGDDSRYLAAYRPAAKRQKELSKRQRGPVQSLRFIQHGKVQENPGGFSDCPSCLAKHGGQKIRNIATLGERPFATLVREQLVRQPILERVGPEHPNGGRKTLLFSDGRQRAARLARDLPREVEFDGFRQALVAAVHRLNDFREDRSALDDYLYTAFVSVCHDHNLPFFDREDDSAQTLQNHIRYFHRSFSGELETALDDEWIPTPPRRFPLALLRQVCDPYYSLHNIQVGVLTPTRRILGRLRRDSSVAERLGDRLLPTVTAWITSVLDNGAFDPRIEIYDRLQIVRYPHLANNYPLSSELTGLLGLSATDVTALERLFHETLTEIVTDELRALVPRVLRIHIAVDETWWVCGACHLFCMYTIEGCCPFCGSAEIRAQAPDDVLIQSRAEYFREPIRDALKGIPPVFLTAEEHTAQLSHRDRSAVWATTEEFELRFQDITLSDDKPPVDVLSCTTTMEVGIDIGSLNAIGLGNVPPQRENYQQRAGRAGRRASAVSTVLTYARDDAHDAHYFDHPVEIIAGPPRAPRIDLNNPHIAKRHLNALLVQTFFHAQLDQKGEAGLSVPEQAGLMTALSTKNAFFESDSTFSFSAFEHWLDKNAFGSDGAATQWLTAWLPDGLFDREDATNTRVQQVREWTDDLREALEQVKRGRTRAVATDEESEDTTLLDVLFDSGLLPTYAFPTDLCSFVIFGRDGKGRVRIQEKMDQGKERALGEYAPGRLLVVNKKTYRVGGIVIGLQGGERQALRKFFAKPLEHVVFCPDCTYVRIDQRKEIDEVCPICATTLSERPIIDPPAFAPAGGRDIRGDDAYATYSEASQAQLPIPLEPDRFTWQAAGQRWDATSARHQKLIVTNAGPDDQGFLVCRDCGTIWPGNAAIPDSHFPPVPARNGLQRCTGMPHETPIVLGHVFATDLLLLRAQVAAPLETDPRTRVLPDTLRTLAEALALAASFELDCDPRDLQAGYRFISGGQAEHDPTTLVDFFLYDSASGGAGYALEAHIALVRILDRAERLLTECPVGCDQSCTRCLRHYGNRFWHEMFDRYLALDLLRYLRYGRLPEISSPADQEQMLLPLRHYLELSGELCSTGAGMAGAQVPLLVRRPDRSGASVAVWARPPLLTEDGFLRLASRSARNGDIVVSRYDLNRDLPGEATRVRSLARFH